MRYLLLVVASMFFIGCGYSSINNESIGQVKKVINLTPLVCSDRVDVDISLGVMRDGVGSMSTQDIELYVPKEEHQKLLKLAATQGSLVKVTYSSYRITWCLPEKVVTNVEIVK